MTLAIRKIQVWSGEIPDRPGAAAAKLEELAHAGADLEFLFTRPHRSKPDTSVLFIAPITSPEQVTAQWLNAILQRNGYMTQGEISSLSKAVSRPFVLERGARHRVSAAG